MWPSIIRKPGTSATNNGTAWRKADPNQLQWTDAGGEGNHYPWRVKVNQRTGESRTAAELATAERKAADD